MPNSSEAERFEHLLMRVKTGTVPKVLCTSIRLGDSEQRRPAISLYYRVAGGPWLVIYPDGQSSTFADATLAIAAAERYCRTHWGEPHWTAD